MPLCTSLPGHNPRYWDVVESLDVAGRNHELLARRAKNNVERHGVLYTPMADLEELADVKELISTYNNKLYYRHTERQLMLDLATAYSNTSRQVKALRSTFGMLLLQER